MAMSNDDKIALYSSYQVFRDSMAGKAFYGFLDVVKTKAIEKGMSSDDPEARGKYGFIRDLERYLDRIEHDAEEAQKNTRR